MVTGGLRERKKRQTRQLVADTAARLFAERGYEQVTIVDIARAADVSEQTVYNYFPTKHHLVLDRDQELSDRLTELIRDRPPGTTPAGALRSEALALVEGIKSVPSDQARGGLGYLATMSPMVRRLCLEMTDRHADAMATAIIETTDLSNYYLAKVQAVALASVFQTITDESGRRTRAGDDPAKITDDLRPIIEDIIDDLDRWLRTADHVGRRCGSP